MKKDQSMLLDHPEGYGLISRTLHWLMAALFAWQFMSAFLHAIDREMSATQFFWSQHYSFGFLLFVAVVLRGIWALINLRNRPSQTPGFLGTAARLGHVALYLLMIIVPALAILRTYGNGRGISLFGFQVFSGAEERIPALVAPATALHGVLGWTLLALVLGHIVMALVHAFVWREETLSRMLRGRPRSAAQAE